MGLYDRDYIRERQLPRNSFTGPRSMVTNLILINVAVALIDALSEIAGVGQTSWFNEFLMLKVGLPGDALAYLSVYQGQFWQLQLPFNLWQLLTAGFAHGGIEHLFWNMLALWIFGRDVEDYYGRQEFLKLYLLILVIANAVYVVMHLLPGLHQPFYTACLGASGAISGVVILYCLLFPNRTILFMFVIPMPAWVLGVVFVVMDLMGATGHQGPSGIAHEVHLAGAAMGFLYWNSKIRLSNYIPDFNGFSGFSAITDWFKNFKRPQLKVHRPSSNSKDSENDMGPNVLEAEVDRILDKINREGEEKLTEDERATLEEASRRAKQKRR